MYSAVPSPYRSSTRGSSRDTSKAFRSFDDVKQCDVERFRRFFHLLLERGIYLAPSAFESAFLSSAHTRVELDATLEAADDAFAAIAHT